MAEENENQDKTNCPYCGEEILKEAKKCKHCGEWLDGQNHETNAIAKKEPLPQEYKKFNWGAFLLTWIWGVVNKSYLTFLVFLGVIVAWIPVVGWIAQIGFGIWFGIKGNEWAWQNKDWRSLDHFNDVQRKWAMWSAISLGIIFVVGFVIMLCIAIVAAMGSY